eukprot:UN18017
MKHLNYPKGILSRYSPIEITELMSNIFISLSLRTSSDKRISSD